MRDETGWLPPELDEYPTTCIQMQIPDNLQYRAAFYGALAELTKGYNWQVGGNEAREIAIGAYWNRLIFETLTENCEGEAQAMEFRMTEECGLEYSPDGENWTPVSGWTAFAPDCFTGEAGPAGPAGEAGPAGPVAPDAATVPTPPSSANGMQDACSIATGVVESVLDNYVLPALDLYVDEIVTLGMSQLETQRELLNVATGGAITSGLGALWGNVAQILYNAGLTVGATIHATVLTFAAWINSISAVSADNARDELRTSPVRDVLICLLFERLGETNNITSAVYEGWKDDIENSTDLSADVKGALLGFLNDNLPLYAIRMEAAYNADAVGDCAACIADHYYAWDFTASDGGWSATRGTWASGEGWKQNFAQVSVTASDALVINKSSVYAIGRSIRRIEVEAYLDVGQRAGSGLGAIFVLEGIVEGTSPDYIGAVEDFDGLKIYNADPAFGEFRQGLRITSWPAIRQAIGAPAPNPRGFVTVRSVRIWYNGTDAGFTGGSGF